MLLTPVPATLTLLGEFVALLEMLTVPLTLPAAFGANATLNSAVCPAAIVVPATPLFLCRDDIAQPCCGKAGIREV